MKKNTKSSSQKNSSQRILQGGVILGALLVISSSISIPFIFESPSMYYKLGMDKTLLQAGKVLGLIPAVLILFQVILVSRIPLLETVFSMKSLYAFHRFSGTIIPILLLLHPFFIVAADDFTFFPLEQRYLPEFIGAGLLVLILGISGISVWQKEFGLSHKRWHFLHRLGTPFAVLFLFVHIFFVSESFDSGIPLTGLCIAGGAALLLFIRLYYKRRLSWKKS